MDGATYVTDVARLDQLGGPTSASGYRLFFDNHNRTPCASEGDRCGQPVRAGTDNHSIDGRHVTEATTPRYARPMVTTIVLATCDIHQIPETAQAIADLNDVSEVYSVAGDYDLVVMVRTRTHEDLARVVSEEIARVPGVERTQTLVAFKVFSRHDVEALFSVGFEEEVS